MRITELLETKNIHFRTSDDIRDELRKACAGNKNVATFVELGLSEAGRPIDAVIVGNGVKTVSLIAGAHSDEPVGPETLRFFILEVLSQKNDFSELLAEYKFVIVPHINPDGEAHNQGWIKQWPDITAYLHHVYREPPGRDLEFGFPAMRKENRLVADFLQQHKPFQLHMSLHGMGVADGAMLLIERHWIEVTGELRQNYTELLQSAGFELYDHDRKGEKGFHYIGPGFTTTPEGVAMRAYFQSINDPESAGLFHSSSMEYVRSLSDGPLCLVTELPLFTIGKKVKKRTGKPVAYLQYKERLPEIRNRVMKGESIETFIEEFQIAPVNIDVAVNLQLHALSLGLDTIASG